MSTELEVVPSGAGELAELVEQVRINTEAARAEATRLAYRLALKAFGAWCRARGLEALPAVPGTVALYLSWLAQQGRSVRTMAKVKAAISQAHQLAGLDNPVLTPLVKETWKGIGRRYGVPAVKKTALRGSELRRVVGQLPGPEEESRRLIDLRDRALLLVGFAGAFRRSELVSLEVAHLRREERGIEVLLPRSKTDQTGIGLVKFVSLGERPETCPVAALEAWLAAAGISSGALFRSVNRHGRVSSRPLGDQAVCRSLKRAVARAGLDPAEFGAHSLRSGFITSMAAGGMGLREIMLQSGHRSLQTLLGYVQAEERAKQNYAARAGL